MDMAVLTNQKILKFWVDKRCSLKNLTGTMVNRDRWWESGHSVPSTWISNGNTMAGIITFLRMRLFSNTVVFYLFIYFRCISNNLKLLFCLWVWQMCTLYVYIDISVEFIKINFIWTANQLLKGYFYTFGCRRFLSLYDYINILY